MDDEDGRCLLDVICDPQALNDFLHGSEKIDSDDLLDNTGEATSAFFEGAGLHVQEPPGSHLTAEPSQPAPSVDLDFLEDDILGSPSGGAAASLPGPDQPCDILQQSLQEANITEQTLEAEAELDLGAFQLPTLQPVVAGGGPDGPAQLFPGGPDLLGLQPPAVLTHQAALVQPAAAGPAGADVVGKALGVQPFLQPVGLGNVTLQPLSNLQGLPNGSPGGALGLGPIQVVGPPVVTINQQGQPLLAKPVPPGQVATVPVGGYLAPAAAETLAPAGVSPQGAPPGLVLQKNLAAAAAAGGAPPAALNGTSVFGGLAGPQPSQPLTVASSLSSPLVPAQSLVIHRTPTPIQPKPAGVLPQKLYQISPKPFGPGAATLTLQNEAAGLPPAKAGPNLTFMAGKPGPNVVLSGFPPGLPANVFKPPAPQPPGALSKPMSLHLLNQGSSIVIPAQHVPPAVLHGQNQFLLPGQLAGASAVQLPPPLSALQANVGGQILAAAPHPGGPAHIIASQGPGGQLIANQGLPAQLLANQNLASPLSLGPVLASPGAHGTAHILSGPIQLQPGQVGQPTLFQMPVSLAGSPLATQTQPAAAASLPGGSVIQGVALPSQVAMLNAPEGLGPAVGLPAPPAPAAPAPAAAAAQNPGLVAPAAPGLLPGGDQAPGLAGPAPAPQTPGPAPGPVLQLGLPAAPPAAQAPPPAPLPGTPQPSPGLASSPEKVALGPVAASPTVLGQDSVHMFLQQERRQQQQQQQQPPPTPTPAQPPLYPSALKMQPEGGPAPPPPAPHPPLPLPVYSIAGTALGSTSSVPASVIVSSSAGTAQAPPPSAARDPPPAPPDGKGAAGLVPQFPAAAPAPPVPPCQVAPGRPAPRPASSSASFACAAPVPVRPPVALRRRGVADRRRGPSPSPGPPSPITGGVQDSRRAPSGLPKSKRKLGLGWSSGRMPTGQAKLPGVSPSAMLPHPPLESPHQARPPSRPPSRPHSQPQTLSRPPSEPPGLGCAPPAGQPPGLFAAQTQLASSPHGAQAQPEGQPPHPPPGTAETPVRGPAAPPEAAHFQLQFPAQTPVPLKPPTPTPALAPEQQRPPYQALPSSGPPPKQLLERFHQVRTPGPPLRVCPRSLPLPVFPQQRVQPGIILQAKPVAAPGRASPGMGQFPGQPPSVLVSGQPPPGPPAPAAPPAPPPGSTETKGFPSIAPAGAGGIKGSSGPGKAAVQQSSQPKPGGVISTVSSLALAKGPLQIQVVTKGLPQLVPGTPGPSSQPYDSKLGTAKKPPTLQPSKEACFLEQLHKHQGAVLHPDYKAPFRSFEDALHRLLPYHVYQGTPPAPHDYRKVDEEFEVVSTQLLKRTQAMLNKYRLLLLEESRRVSPSAEMVMIDRMFIQEEKTSLSLDKQLAKERPDDYVSASRPQGPAAPPTPAPESLRLPPAPPAPLHPTKLVIKHGGGGSPSVTWAKAAPPPAAAATTATTAAGGLDGDEEALPSRSKPPIKTYEARSRIGLKLKIKQEAGLSKVVHNTALDPVHQPPPAPPPAPRTPAPPPPPAQMNGGVDHHAPPPADRKPPGPGCRLPLRKTYRENVEAFGAGKGEAAAPAEDGPRGGPGAAGAAPGIRARGGGPAAPPPPAPRAADDSASGLMKELAEVEDELYQRMVKAGPLDPAGPAAAAAAGSGGAELAWDVLPPAKRRKSESLDVDNASFSSDSPQDDSLTEHLQSAIDSILNLQQPAPPPAPAARAPAPFHHASPSPPFSSPVHRPDGYLAPSHNGGLGTRTLNR
ncbi:BRD4-interacting chromatin-remodeling complex-associated protein [Tachyglossus aculeatus]|uniref:BRD4-interacting chromatin-remodeling complex-associated protein n=1 Tax=Tachyglossus aculeatus TaxID=9261 RepID=UPI0018F75026|nr:BRD4-interacting chromatin-remodeling complex-associated protein [Tachyglossus aculeatus]